MTKVGLAVCYDAKNFGSQLQILATVRIIEKKEMYAEIIRYEKKLTFKFLINSLPRLLNPYFMSGKFRRIKRTYLIRKNKDVQKNVDLRNERFKKFSEQYLCPISQTYCGWEKLRREVGIRYNVVLCGSDQLWLPANLGSHFYTLEFVPDDMPKVAYATSFGVSDIPAFQKKRTKKYLQRFQSLSTRELSGQEIIRNLIDRRVPVVCDPTLLFDANEWLEMIPDKEVVDEPYIFCYYLGTGMRERIEADKLKEITGYRIVTCPFLDNYIPYDEKFGDERCFDVDAADFLNLVRHAKYVLTDSFHGTIFSILYHKKFITFDRFKNGANSRNSRISSLFTVLGLEERKFTDDICYVMDTVNWIKVDEKVDKLRLESLQYLENALSGNRLE